MNHIHILFSFCIVSIPFLTNASAAEPPSVAPIIVTAPRLKSDLSKKTITAADIRANQYQHVTDALITMPGIYVAQEGSPGQITKVFVRGGNSEHTNVVIDGIKVNDPTDPSGASNFAGLGTEGAATITVSKGASIADGEIDALSGSIVMETKRGEGAPMIDASVEAGSFNTRTLNAGLQGVSNGADYQLRMVNEGTRGTCTTPTYARVVPRQSGNDPSDRTSFIARTGAALNDTWRVNLWNRIQKTDVFYSDKWRANPARLSTTDAHFHRGELEGALTHYKMQLGYSLAKTDRTIKNAFAPFRDQIMYNGRVDTVYNKNEVRLNSYYTAHVNVATERQEYQAEDDYRQIKSHAIHQTAAIGHKIKPTNAWLVELWGRLHNHTAFKRRYSTKAMTRYGVKNTGTTVMASYSTGIRAPSLYQLHDPLSGNASLRPETAKGYDLGIEQEIIGRRLTTGSTYFVQNFTDLIENRHIKDDQWTYINVGRAKTHGVESFIAATIVKPVTVRLEHTFLHAKDSVNNVQLMRRPMHKMAMQAIVAVSDAFHIGVGWVKYGKFADYDMVSQNRTYKRGPSVFRLWASYKLRRSAKSGVSVGNRSTSNASKLSSTPDIELFARVENALGKGYEYPSGFAAPGFAVYVGARFQFGGD